MSRPPKKWPTVANRHRTEAIDLSGDIITESRRIEELLKQLQQAINTANIQLGLAIRSDVQARVRLMASMAANIQTTLEHAPANDTGDEDDDDD